MSGACYVPGGGSCGAMEAASVLQGLGLPQVRRGQRHRRPVRGRPPACPRQSKAALPARQLLRDAAPAQPAGVFMLHLPLCCTLFAATARCSPPLHAAGCHCRRPLPPATAAGHAASGLPTSARAYRAVLCRLRRRMGMRRASMRRRCGPGCRPRATTWRSLC